MQHLLDDHQPIRELTRAIYDATGKLLPMPVTYPTFLPLIIRIGVDGCPLSLL